MPDYKAMYLTLLDKTVKSIEMLQTALTDAEEIYINSEETIIDISKLDNTEKEIGRAHV